MQLSAIIFCNFYPVTQSGSGRQWSISFKSDARIDAVSNSVKQRIFSNCLSNVFILGSNDLYNSFILDFSSKIKIFEKFKSLGWVKTAIFCSQIDLLSNIETKIEFLVHMFDTCFSHFAIPAKMNVLIKNRRWCRKIIWLKIDVYVIKVFVKCLPKNCRF